MKANQCNQAIEISETAKKKLKQLLSESSANNPAIRLFINGYGWGGPSFGMSLEEIKKDGLACVLNELPFVLDPGVEKILSMLGTVSIDYRDRMLLGGTFNIQLKNQRNDCC